MESGLLSQMDGHIKTVWGVKKACCSSKWLSGWDLGCAWLVAQKVGWDALSTCFPAFPGLLHVNYAVSFPLTGTCGNTFPIKG